MGGIGQYNYEGYPLAEKYGWFRAGPGAAAAIAAGDALKGIAAELDVSDGTIGYGLIERRLGSGWQGGAARSASGAFDRAAAVLSGLASSGGAGGGTAHQYGDSFAATKNAIPAPPPPVGDNSWWGRRADELGGTLQDTFGSDLGVQSDYRARLTANRDADTAANDALRRHEDTTRAALSSYQAAAVPDPPSSSGSAATPADTVSGPRTLSGHGAGGNDIGSAIGPAGDPVRGSAGGPAGLGHPGPAAGPIGTQPAASAENGGPIPAPPDTPTRADPAPGPTGGYVPVTNPRTAGPPPSARTPSSTRVGGGTPARGAGPGVVPEFATRGGQLTPGPNGTGLRGAGPLGGGANGGGPTGGSPNSAGLNDGGPNGGRPNGGYQNTPAGEASTRGGLGGVSPMGLGGVGAGQRQGSHRNQYYIPEDEPFRVEYDFYIAPAVLGVDQRDEPSR